MYILQLRETLRNAEKDYLSAQTSFDNSNELIMAKSALKAARFDYAECAMDLVEEMIMMGELK